jgi:hypothetical protein
VRIVVLIPLLLATSTVLAQNAGGGFWSWLNKNLFDPVSVSGSKRMGYHFHEVSGDRTSFDQQNYFGDGDQAFTDYTDLYIRGEKVLGFLNFETRVTNNRFGTPQDQRFTLVYESKLFDTKLGDITGSLHNTNPLVSFSRRMSGVSGALKLGGGYELKLMGSENKAAPRTVTLPGNNSKGPYYLPGGNIVDGSLSVRVDDRPRQLGTDYMVDYQTGLLEFVTEVIPPTSVIQATYESYGFNNRGGTVYGASMLLPFARNLNVELTAIEQKSNAGSGLSTRTERFYGYGAPSTPYDLQYEPLIDEAHPFLLTVDSIPQVLGVDFYFDEFLPFRFYFTRYVPTTSIIEATYTPRPTTGAVTDGDKRVYGLSARWQPFAGAAVQYNLGQSTLFSPGGSVKGSAQSAQFSYRIGKLSLRANLTDIPAEYTTIASTGFRRNERGQAYDLDYDFGNGLKLSANLTKSRISSPQYGAEGDVTDVTADNSGETLSLNYAPGSGGNWSLSHSKNTFASASGESANTTDSLRYSQKFGRLSTSLEFSNTSIDYASFSDEGSRERSDIQSVGLAAAWEVNDWLTASTNVSQNRVSGSRGSSNGRDISLDLNARVSERLTARLSLSDSNSGYYNYGNYGSGYGYGYGSGSFSGGGGGYGSSGLGVKQRGYSLNVHYAPWQQLSLELSHSQRLASGDNLSNSDLRSTTLAVGYMPTNWLRFSSTLCNQDVAFVSGGGTSNTTIYTLGVSAGPWRRWSLNLDYQRMLTGSSIGDSGSGATSYDQNMGSYYARLMYSISDRQRAFFDARSGSTVGYLASNDANWALGYEFDINRFVTLIAAYRVRDQRNLDEVNSAYSYSSRSFDIDLSIHF